MPPNERIISRDAPLAEQLTPLTATNITTIEPVPESEEENSMESVPSKDLEHSPKIYPSHEKSQSIVKVGDNMFSDESELSDYNPYADDSGDESPSTKPKTLEAAAAKPKPNYFVQSQETEPTPSHPITLDPKIAAALRKAASLADNRGIPTQVQEETKMNRMSLGGMDGVYEFDEVDIWDGEEDDEIGSKNRKRKEKK